MTNTPKNPETEPTPIVDSEAPWQRRDRDHKVAANPPTPRHDAHGTPEDPDHRPEGETEE